MAYDYWMVIAKNTNMGDVEVWHGDFEDCEEFCYANGGMLNGAELELVPDMHMNELLSH